MELKKNVFYINKYSKYSIVNIVRTIMSKKLYLFSYNITRTPSAGLNKT